MPMKDPFDPSSPGPFLLAPLLGILWLIVLVGLLAVFLYSIHLLQIAWALL